MPVEITPSNSFEFTVPATFRIDPLERHLLAQLNNATAASYIRRKYSISMKDSYEIVKYLRQSE